MLLMKDTVGKLRILFEDVFDIEKENLFPRSLMGATIQDGGTRERRGLITLILTLSLKKKKKNKLKKKKKKELNKKASI